MPVMDPMPGKIAAAIEELAADLLQEVAPDESRGTIDDYVDLITSNPRAGAAVDIKTLNLLQRVGDYTHEDPAIKEFIDESFNQMDGSLNIALAEMATASPIGWSASEWSVREPENSQWWLQSIQLLPPRFSRFEGRLGNITAVRYKGETEVEIPYGKVVHVVNRRHVAALTRNQPYGVADCRLAIAAHKAWKILLNEMLIAGQRQATPILVGYSDPNGWAHLTDANGQPILDRATGEPVRIPAANHLQTQLQNLNQNGGVISLSDVTQSKVEALRQETNGQFFLEALHYLDKVVMLAFLVPSTSVEEGVGGLGQSGLAQAQMHNMNLMLSTLANQITEELLEKVIRPLIIWNFGEQESYGEFVQPEEDDDQGMELMKILVTAFQTGVIPPTDEAAINRFRRLAGIPEVSDIAQAFSKPTRYWQETA